MKIDNLLDEIVNAFGITNPLKLLAVVADYIKRKSFQVIIYIRSGVFLDLFFSLITHNHRILYLFFSFKGGSF